MYSLSWNNLDKKIPKNFDKLVIPEIERITKSIKGTVLKNKIYNYLIHYFNIEKPEGILESIYIYSEDETKRIYYKIEPDKIEIKLLSD